MGKIEINYSECGNLAKNLEFVLDNIVKEKKSINNAIYILKNVKDNYGDIEDLNQCLENKIVSLNSEEEKVRSFIIDFKKYIQDISDVDNQLANDIRKKSKIYINNVSDYNKETKVITPIIKFIIVFAIVMFLALIIYCLNKFIK